MAFLGCKFSFDGISCEEHDLIIYNIGSKGQSGTTFANVVSIQEEHIANHWKPLFFGVTYENKLECEIVFGLNQERIEDHRPLSRQEMSAVSSWLVGHSDYKWLEIEQEDLVGIRYRCMVTELQVLDEDGAPWAFLAKFTCDGPYAYLQPEEYTYQVLGELVVEFNNKSDHNGLYRPTVVLMPEANAPTDDGDASIGEGSIWSITNHEDGHTMQFRDIPESITTITIDNENGVISSDPPQNLYPHFNFKFLHLKRGMNTLCIRGYGLVRICCEFPVSVGM